MAAREQLAGYEDFYGLDPRWDWFEITAIGDRERQYIKGACRHLETVPVESLTGEVVAQLCLTCDAHFYRGSAA